MSKSERFEGLNLVKKGRNRLPTAAAADGSVGARFVQAISGRRSSLPARIERVKRKNKERIFMQS